MNLEEQARRGGQAKKQIELIHKHCSNAGLHSSPIIKKDYNYESTVQDGKEKIKIQVYFGKKGVKTILQGNVDSGLYKTVNNLVIDEPRLDLKQNAVDEPEKYIGSDECGKGDIFGPLVVCAVYVNKTTSEELKKIGVRDSKEISDFQIGSLAKKIKSIIDSNYEIVNINPEKYNKLYDEFQNLNKLLNWAHSKAIEKLLEKTKCTTVITDKFSNTDLSISRSAEHVSVKFIQLTKAESYTAVAAASIIARDAFNYWFNTHKKNNIELPKGSSEKAESFLKNMLKNFNKDEMSKLAKLHFKTFKKLNGF
ncbi:MAG: ribonuclease HIII [Ignavibacteriales bacterium]|nr:ribonuclease HIII [Ignavibacteriales bacterium]